MPHTTLASAPPTVRRLAWTSFWTDISSKMVRAIEPLFLVDSVGLGRDMVGLLEGAAKGVECLLRWRAGRWSDRLERRKPLTLLGYVFSMLSRPLLAVAPSSLAVALAKAGDRAGAGLRKAPRNAWLADTAYEHGTPPHGAFLFQKAMDNAGAALGLLVAVGLVIAARSPRQIIWLSVLPALIGLAVLGRLQESARAALPSEGTEQTPAGQLPAVDRAALRRTLALAFALGLSNISEKLMVIYAVDAVASHAGTRARFLLGASAICTVFLAAALVGGAVQRWTRTIGVRASLAAGLMAHAIVFIGFCLPAAPRSLLFGLFACQGIFEALARPAARALAAACARDAGARGAAVGAFEGAEGIADTVATPLAAFLWVQGPGWTAAMLFGLAATAAAGIALLRIQNTR